MISAVVAYTKNKHVIGNHGEIPWAGTMADDMRRVRELTDGTALIMGLKTFESIGRALPGRQNIVLSSQDLHIDGVQFAKNLDEAIAKVEPGRETIIFGGGFVYREALPVTDRIFATEIDADFDGDTTFPEIDAKHWCEISRQDFPADSENKFPFSFVTYERIAKS